MRDGNYGGDGSPASIGDELRRCESYGGWFDYAAGVCDYVGVGGD